MEWQEIYGNWVLVPPRPIAIIHFLGGAFVATAPQVTYRALLEYLAAEGYVIVATPFVNTLDHVTIAQRVMRMSNLALDYLCNELLRRDASSNSPALPIYGLGHSMGCKLHLLIGSLFPQQRAGNILISFNNYPAKRSIPLVEQFTQFSKLAAQVTSQFAAQLDSQLTAPLPQVAAFDVEFTPSPAETSRLIAERYQVRRNLLIKFNNDDLDQTRALDQALQQRFPELTSVLILKGNHLTPLGQEVNWRAGREFTPFDAVGQFFKQELTRDLNQLKQELLCWLNPLESLG
ncbi:MAG: DUF1350 family protein [Pegethrix bostrychoides GSE-TBD4-15B]|jgi:hypothetical protein|uniref:DUF1350 family protein n=1 Tax=Pegethrix bostrychoides GSE-TBD4-15B TaxID=2839662 RepID=A0A951P9K5_9CYAN|nr:DUF1350 family protein [Pegethrix bostrychoides GSE-TBD4-15B]